MTRRPANHLLTAALAATIATSIWFASQVFG